MHQIDQIEVQKKYKYKEDSDSGSVSDSGSKFQIMTTEYYHEYDCTENDWGLFVEIDLPSIPISTKYKKMGNKLYIKHLSSIKEEEDDYIITDDDKKTIKENLDKGEITQLYLGILICSLTIYLIHFCVIMG